VSSLLLLLVEVVAATTVLAQPVVAVVAVLVATFLLFLGRTLVAVLLPKVRCLSQHWCRIL